VRLNGGLGVSDGIKSVLVDRFCGTTCHTTSKTRGNVECLMPKSTSVKTAVRLGAPIGRSEYDLFESCCVAGEQ